MSALHWPCPHNCLSWCRDDVRMIDGVPIGTDHHPRCEYVNESLIDVWRVHYGKQSYVTDRKPLPEDLAEGETVTTEKMHKEIYEQLPDFNGF